MTNRRLFTQMSCCDIPWPAQPVEAVATPAAIPAMPGVAMPGTNCNEDLYWALPHGTWSLLKTSLSIPIQTWSSMSTPFDKFMENGWTWRQTYKWLSETSSFEDLWDIEDSGWLSRIWHDKKTSCSSSRNCFSSNQHHNTIYNQQRCKMFYAS